MEYAIVEIAGKQYTVAPGKTVAVDTLAQPAGETVTFDKVLLLVNDTGTTIGAPYVAGVTVTAKIIEHKKSKKIDVLRFRAKSHYHKARGHRQVMTRLLIDQLQTNKKAAKA